MERVVSANWRQEKLTGSSEEGICYMYMKCPIWKVTKIFKTNETVDLSNQIIIKINLCHLINISRTHIFSYLKEILLFIMISWPITSIAFCLKSFIAYKKVKMIKKVIISKKNIRIIGKMLQNLKIPVLQLLDRSTISVVENNWMDHIYSLVF